MRIDEKLNFVMPIFGNDDEIEAYVHSMPIGRDAFRANYMLLSVTFTALHNQGLSEATAPKISAMLLQDVAKQQNFDATPLLNEILRLSCLIKAGSSGWETIPLQESINRKLIDQDDADEVMGALVFFTLASWAPPKRIAKQIVAGAARLWAAQISSLQSTEWIASLPTLTATDNSGATAPSNTFTQMTVSQNNTTFTSSLPS